jgi:hypothetical protein
MRKLKPKHGPVTVVHLRTADVIKNPPITNRFAVPRRNLDDYSISSYFLVNNAEWIIESKCHVFITGHIYKATRKPLQHDEGNHNILIQLIQIQAQDLFNALIGRKYDNVEIGMKGDGYDCDACASGYIYDNKIELGYTQNGSYFKIGKQFQPFFHLWLREW